MHKINENKLTKLKKPQLLLNKKIKNNDILLNNLMK